MLDLPKLLHQFGNLAERRSSLLIEEAKLWTEVTRTLTESASAGQATPRQAELLPPNDEGVDRLLSTQQTAIALNLTTSTLAKWRVYGGGPEFAKFGRRVFYRQSALTRFITAKTFPHTSAYK